MEIFKEMKKKGWHDARLIDVSGKPKNKGNVATTDFEKKAVAAMKEGKTFFEEIGETDGKPVFRRDRGAGGDEGMRGLSPRQGGDAPRNDRLRTADQVIRRRSLKLAKQRTPARVSRGSLFGTVTRATGGELLYRWPPP